MKTLLITMLYKLARAYYDTGVFDRVEAAVRKLINVDAKGEDKRKAVREEVKEGVKKEGGIVSTTAIDTIIQMVLLKWGG